MGVVVENLGKGGNKPKGVWGVFKGGGAGGTYFQVRDVGNNPRHGPGTGGVSTHSIQMYHWEEAPEVIGQELVVPNFGYGNALCGILRGRGICAEESEYSRAIHFDATNSRPLQGNGAYAGGVGRQKGGGNRRDCTW